MATVYLHIGTPKTGTTALQHLLTENRELLKKHGIVFPDLGFRYKKIGNMRNGHFLVAPFRNADGSLDYTRPCADYEPALAMLGELGKEYGRILLSDEGIWNAAQRRGGFWEQLKQDFEKRGLQVRIIVYLRRQDLFAQSMYVQKIRQTNCTDSFGDYLADVLSRRYPVRFDYDRYARSLAEVFGWDALTIRIFEKEQFAGPENNLFSDFLNIFDLRMTDGFVTEKSRYNERMSKAQVEIKRLLNYLPVSRTDNDLLLASIRAVQELPLDGHGCDNTTYFESGRQKAFLDTYADANAHLARTYFKREDGRLFFEPLQELPTLSLPDRLLLEQTITLYGQAFDTLVQQNKKQADQISQLQNDIRALREDVVWYRLKRKASHILKKKD